MITLSGFISPFLDFELWGCAHLKYFETSKDKIIHHRTCSLLHKTLTEFNFNLPPKMMSRAHSIYLKYLCVRHSALELRDLSEVRWKIYEKVGGAKEKDSDRVIKFYSVFQRFSKTKSANEGSILSSSQFLKLPQLPQKIELTSKVVKVDSKIIISLPKI